MDLRIVSLRGRVLTIFSLIMIAVMICGGVVLMSNAQEAIRAETDASREMAKKFSLAAIGSLIRAGDADSILADLPIHLQHPRHVRIAVLDLQGEPVGGTPAKGTIERDAKSRPPKWFQDWFRPPVEIVRIPVVLGRRPLGSVVITTEPSDEIAEVWDDFRGLFFIMLAGCAGVLISLYWALGRALKPLSVISQGLEQLEAGDYSAKLPPIHVPDLKRIGIRFNALAAALDRTTKEKEALSHKLITVQDNERKNIALELHDEFGPCLFGIKVDASFIETNARKALNGKGAEIAERAGAILKIVDHIQDHNRALLYRLRPMALGHFGLPQLLRQLVSDFAGRYTETEWLIDTPEEFSSGGETFDLTLYRMVQECLTNAARHSGASRVSVLIRPLEDQQSRAVGLNGEQAGAVAVTVSDDGCGIGPAPTPGMGLTGMAERVRALGGAFEISSRASGGTTVTARIPFNGEERRGPSAGAQQDKGAFVQ